MIEYSEESLKELFINKEFINDYNLYVENNENIQNLKKTLDQIELNKKYFRLTIDKVNVGVYIKYLFFKIYTKIDLLLLS